MKKQKKDTKKSNKNVSKTDLKKPKNLKKGKRKAEQSQEDSDFDQFDSLSDIYDSQEDNFTESLEQQGQVGQKQNQDQEEENQYAQIQQELEEELSVAKQQQSQSEKKQASYNKDFLKRHSERNLRDKQLSSNPKEVEQNRRKLEQLQKIRLQKYLKKTPPNDVVSLKTQDQPVSNKIKLQHNQTSSLAPEPSDSGNRCEPSEYGSQMQGSLIKPECSEAKSKKSMSQSQDPQFLSYLVKIMNGTVTVEDIQFRKKQEEKRQKLQDRIKDMQKRKIEEKLKKQFDARSQSQMKVPSTNMDTQYDKLEVDSFRMPSKNQIDRIKTQIRGQEYAQNGRKKRTRVTPDMLKLIIKDFEYMAKQQNGLVPDSLRVTFKDIGKKYKLGRSSIMKMYSDYCKDPTMKSRFQNKQPMAHNRSMMQLTKRRITFVEKLIRKDCTLSQREIAAQMNMHDDLKCKRKKRLDQTAEQYLNSPYHPIAYKAVSRLMKLGNFTRKKVTLIPKNRNSQRTIQQRYNFCRILNQLIADQNNKLYFLDECRFNLFTSRDWGWAPRGELATKIRHNSKGKDIMLLAIIGKEGLIGHQISDSYNRGSFTIAVNKLVNNIIPQSLPQGQRIYLILDNCPIHNKDNLKYLQSTLPLTILYLPPYSPMLNPIESWFGELKRIVKSKIYKTRQAMKAQLVTVLETFKNKSLDNYYKGIVKYIALGLKRQLYRGNNKF